MNLVDKLEPRYFDSMCNAAVIQYNGKPVRIVGCQGENVVCESQVPGELGETIRVPKDHVVGWRTFSYPSLGYRRINNAVLFIEKRQSAYRGLRNNTINITYSPVGRSLRSAGHINTSMSHLTSNGLWQQLFFPTFDSVSDLSKLISGDVTGVVLSDKLMVEPALRGKEERYNIFLNQRIIGSMDASRNMTFTSPKHRKVFTKVLKETV